LTIILKKVFLKRYNIWRVSFFSWYCSKSPYFIAERLRFKRTGEEENKNCLVERK